MLISLLLPYLIVIISTILFTKKWLFSNSTQKPKKNLPPSPPKLPIIGNLHQLGSHPHRIFHSLSQHYGPLMLLHLANVPLLIVSSPQAAQRILKTHDPIFSNRPKSIVADGIYSCKDIAFSPYGDYWRQIKSICVNQLLSNKKVQSFGRIREEEVALMIQKVRRLSAGENVVNLSELFACLTNDVICRVALGKKYGDGEGRKFKDVLERLGVLLGSFNVGEYVPWLRWVECLNGVREKIKGIEKEIDGVLDDVVKEHLDQEGINGSDFVDVLLGIQRGGECGFVLDLVSIKALILDMFAAGTDTTFTLIEWTLSELIKHENVMVKLKNELRSVAGSHSSIAEECLDKCHYLKAVIKETLRMHPPLPLLVPHESMQDVEVLGYDISAGTRVMVNVWSIGRDPSIWEDPDKFLPERFLDSYIDVKGHHFQLVPFGAGRRGCPGTAFAMEIVELTVANVVLSFKFSLPGGVSRKELDMSEGDGLTVHRKFPLCVLVS